MVILVEIFVISLKFYSTEYTNILIRMSKYDFEFKYRPRYFWELALLKRILLKNIFGWTFVVVFLLKMTFWGCVIGSWLKLNGLMLIEALLGWESIFLFPLGRFRLLDVLWGTLTVENWDVSSANNLGLDWRLLNKSLMHIRNKSGPNIESWGITALILT